MRAGGGRARRRLLLAQSVESVGAGGAADVSRGCPRAPELCSVAQKESERTEKLAEAAFRNFGEAGEIAKKSEESLAQLMEHVEKTRARLEEAKAKQREASEKLKASRVDARGAKQEYTLYEAAVHGLV